MNILYVYPYCNLGGVSSVIRERVCADTENSFDVTCCFSQDSGGSEQLRCLGVDIQLSKDYLNKAIQLLRERSFDTVHVIDKAQFIPDLRRVYNGHLVLEMHSSTPVFLDQITDEIVKQVNLILVPSEWSRQQIASRLSESELVNRIHILPNICLPAEVLSVHNTAGLEDDGVPYLLWIGKVSGGKNWYDALRIFRDLQDQTPCRLLMITGGMINRDQHDKLVSEMIILGIDDKVDWRHSISRETISAVYEGVSRSKGALLCTSLAESFGLVIVESLAHGIPVFSSNTHALPELVQPGVNGNLFPVGNTSIAVAMLRDFLAGETSFDKDAILNSVPLACHPDKNISVFKQLVETGVALAIGLELTKVYTNYAKRKLPIG